MAMLVGLDLGKLADFTAAAFVEQSEPPPPGPFARADERPRDHRLSLPNCLYRRSGWFVSVTL
jgi:hypothetical protein